MCGIGTGRWMAVRIEGLVLILFTVIVILAVFTTDAGRFNLKSILSLLC